MKFNATKSLTFIFAMGLFLFSAQQAFGCSCIGPEPGMSFEKQVTAAATGSEAVFSGKVISVGEPALDQYDRRVKIKVTKTYKGKVSGETVITTAANSAMCGVEFQVGKTYLIYAGSGSQGKLSTNNCSRTAMVNKETKKEFAVLKKIKK